MNIDGRALSQAHFKKLAPKAKKATKTPHKIVSILIGDDEASLMYLRMKQTKAEELGINFEFMTFPQDASFELVVETIGNLNKDKLVKGIMIQLPLPKKFLGEHTTEELLSKISAKKDIDGLTGKSKMLPAVVKAVAAILDDEKLKLKGKYAVVIGSSATVGVPIAKQLKARGATVVVCDINTKNLREETLKADILVSATGEAGLVIGPMVKEGVVVIDVGISKKGDKIEGDVDFESVAPKASKITPVPGGVGPMTIISLMENIVGVLG